MERPLLTLGMRFSNVTTGLSMGVTLKYVKNESIKVRVKCVEDGCPFVLLVSKDDSNSSLAIKTIVEKHNHQLQRILPNQACNARF